MYIHACRELRLEARSDIKDTPCNAMASDWVYSELVGMRRWSVAPIAELMTVMSLNCSGEN